MSGFIDIEDALQSMLNADGFEACAKPLPERFSTPHVLVDMLSAWQANEAQAVYSVDFEVRAGDYAQAASIQAETASWVRSLVGKDVGGVPCYAIDSITIQRAQPDPSNQAVIMATVNASLRVRFAD